MDRMRLDKLLALQMDISRKDAGALVRQGKVCVCGQQVHDSSQKVCPADVTFSGKSLGYQANFYLMMNKPAGVLTAARDAKQPTVMGLVPDELMRRGLQPVGRLDKDTTGLLLLTDDGELAHRLLSPRHHVWKTYQARLVCPPSLCAEERFAHGIELSDFTCQPARLHRLEDGDTPLYEVCLREGKFHQVKRMFAAVGSEVTALCRTGFGPLLLPDTLEQGQCRSLTREETEALLKSGK